VKHMRSKYLLKSKVIPFFALIFATSPVFAEGIALGVPGDLGGFIGIPILIFIGLVVCSSLFGKGVSSAIPIALLLTALMAMLGLATIQSGFGFLILLFTPSASVAFLVISMVMLSKNRKGVIEAAKPAVSSKGSSNAYRPTPLEISYVQALENLGYRVSHTGNERWRVEHLNSHVVTHIRSRQELQAFVGSVQHSANA